ncbi:alpha-ribazole phosphatase family protein [Niveibacterium sp.]|uniref:alpha-ribazole phosphatase family protein n=1 Tax=Niveibacterium sp. TaxID=2017444 RepID=UPI0035B07A57
MDLHLIRHPAVAVAPGTCYGASDVPLAAPVNDAAAHLRPLLPPDAALFASPLSRARLLAEALGEPVLDERLREISFGEWELQRYEAIGRAALDSWADDPLGHRPPGGESAADMAARVLTFLEELRAQKQGEAVVIVAHGGPLRAIAGRLLGLPPERWLALDFAHARLTRIRVEAWGTTLQLFNR